MEPTPPPPRNVNLVLTPAAASTRGVSTDGDKSVNSGVGVSPAALINSIMCYTNSDRTKMRNRPAGTPLFLQPAPPRRQFQQFFNKPPTIQSIMNEESSDRYHIEGASQRSFTHITSTLFNHQLCDVLAHMSLSHQEQTARTDMEREWVQLMLSLVSPSRFQALYDAEMKGRATITRDEVSSHAGIGMEHIALVAEPTMRDFLSSKAYPLQAIELLARLAIEEAERVPWEGLREVVENDRKGLELTRKERRGVENEELCVRDGYIEEMEKESWNTLITPLQQFKSLLLQQHGIEHNEEPTKRRVIEKDQLWEIHFLSGVASIEHIIALESHNRGRVEHFLLFEFNKKLEGMRLQHCREFLGLLEDSLGGTRVSQDMLDVQTQEYFSRRAVVREEMVQLRDVESEEIQHRQWSERFHEEREYFVDVQYMKTARVVFFKNHFEDPLQQMIVDFVDRKCVLEQLLQINQETAQRDLLTAAEESESNFIEKSWELWMLFFEDVYMPLLLEATRGVNALWSQYRIHLRKMESFQAIFMELVEEELNMYNMLVSYEDVRFANLSSKRAAELEAIENGIYQKKRQQRDKLCLEEFVARVVVQTTIEQDMRDNFMTQGCQEMEHHLRRFHTLSASNGWKQLIRVVIRGEEDAWRHKIIESEAHERRFNLSTYHCVEFDEPQSRTYIQWAWNNEVAVFEDTMHKDKQSSHKRMVTRITEEHAAIATSKGEGYQHSPKSAGVKGAALPEEVKTAYEELAKIQEHEAATILSTLYSDWINLKEVMGRGVVFGEEALARRTLSMLWTSPEDLRIRILCEKIESSESDSRRSLEDAMLHTLAVIVPRKYESIVVRSHLLDTFVLNSAELRARSSMCVMEAFHYQDILRDEYDKRVDTMFASNQSKLRTVGQDEGQRRLDIRSAAIRHGNILEQRRAVSVLDTITSSSMQTLSTATSMQILRSTSAMSIQSPVHRMYGSPMQHEAARLVQAVWMRHSLSLKKKKAWERYAVGSKSNLAIM